MYHFSKKVRGTKPFVLRYNSLSDRAVFYRLYVYIYFSDSNGVRNCEKVSRAGSMERQRTSISERAAANGSFGYTGNSIGHRFRRNKNISGETGIDVVDLIIERLGKSEGSPARHVAARPTRDVQIYLLVNPPSVSATAKK